MPLDLDRTIRMQSTRPDPPAAMARRLRQTPSEREGGGGREQQAAAESRGRVMTIDDDSSIYVGGLPYDCTEEVIHRAFDIYGHVVAVKIINDRDIGGKCYGFVTFRNPRSAADAISNMNGRTIGGRVVKVNEVRTRGGRPGFNRENFHRGFVRDNDWVRDNERQRDRFRDRDRYGDHNDRFEEHDRDREREYERGREHDRSREHSFDHERDRDRDREDFDQEEGRSLERKWEKDDEMDWDDDGERKKRRDHERSKEIDRELPAGRLRRGRFKNQRGRDSSSSSGDEYQDEVKDQLRISEQKLEDLQKQVADLQDKIEDEEQNVIDQQKKSQKLEEALAIAKRISSQQKSRLIKIQKTFLQMQDCTDRLKNSEQELRSLVEDVKFVADGEDDAMDDSLYKNISV